MPTVIINGKLEKSYDHWVSAFDGHDDVRKASGLKVLYRGHDLSDASAIHIVLQTPSMEVLGEFMKENAEYMKESGHIPNSGERTVCRHVIRCCLQGQCKWSPVRINVSKL